MEKVATQPATPIQVQPAGRDSRLQRAPGLDFKEGQRPVVQIAEAPEIKAEAGEPRPASIASNSALFEEMRKIGMLDGSARVTGAPLRVAAASPAGSAGTLELPRLPDPSRAPTATAASGMTTAPIAAPAELPSLPKTAPGVVGAPNAPRVQHALAADTAAAIAQRKSAPTPRVTNVVAQSWQPVETRPAARTQIAAAETVSRAPITPVERAELPAVRSSTVVPLKVSEKATDGKPAVITPALPQPTSIAAAPQPPAPELPPLPTLPGATPAASATALPPSAPPPPAIVPTPAMIAKPAPTAAKPIPVAAPAPRAMATPAAPVAKPISAPKPVAKAPPAKFPAAKTPAVKTPATKAAAIAPAAGIASPGARATSANARYLVLHSFKDPAHASRVAAQYPHLGAKVASAQINGQTWHRVVVRDGAAERSRLAADGIRGFWPINL